MKWLVYVCAVFNQRRWVNKQRTRIEQLKAACLERNRSDRTESFVVGCENFTMFSRKSGDSSSLFVEARLPTALKRVFYVEFKFKSEFCSQS